MTTPLFVILIIAVPLSIIYQARKPGSTWEGAARGLVVGVVLWLGLGALYYLLSVILLFLG